VSCGVRVKNPIDFKTGRHNAEGWLSTYFHAVGEYVGVKNRPAWAEARYCPECRLAIVARLQGVNDAEEDGRG